MTSLVASRALVVVALGAALTGCYTMRADLPGHVRNDLAPHVEIIGSIDETFTHIYALGGLFAPPPEDLVSALLLRRVREAGGDGVTNLVFESVFAPPDVLLRTFTLTLVAPRTYRVRADIVRISVPPLPGRALLDDEGTSP